MRQLGVFEIRRLLTNFLREDIGTGDITSDTLISPHAYAQALIICKSDNKGIVAGIEESSIIFDICRCKSKMLVKDGAPIKNGTAVMEIDGRALSILRAERTAINLLMRMSGIATETRMFIDSISNYNQSIRIACTRKTAPGLRFFDKKAVQVGGGDSHRMQLDEMVLIKDNHLFFSNSVGKSVRKAKKGVGSTIKIECEVTKSDDAIRAIKAGADTVMLDNFSPKEVADTIKEIERKGIRGQVRLEVSGGINLRNVKSYAKAKPDIISIGHLTHSAKAVDFSLEIRKKYDLLDA
jgi:nicotinate-nucleotide pyrophosphorylase (carboxylating)